MKKNLIWIIPVSLIILAAIAIPMFKWQQAEAMNSKVTKQQEIIAVQSSFIATYGQTAQITAFIKPEDLKIYGVSWSDGKYIHTSLFVNGVWVEIARQDLPQYLQPTPSPSK